jgi:hypothetical protein
MLQTKAIEKIKTHILYLITFFENLVVYKKKVENYWRAGPGHRWKYGTRALRAGRLRLQTHMLRLCNTHRFSTAKIVAQKGLNLTLHVHCVSCCYRTRHGFITTARNTEMLNAECYMKPIINYSMSVNGVNGQQQKSYHHDAASAVDFWGQSCGGERCTCR